MFLLQITTDEKYYVSERSLLLAFTLETHDNFDNTQTIKVQNFPTSLKNAKKKTAFNDKMQQLVVIKDDS